MGRFQLLLFTTLLVAFLSGCQTPYHTQRGAAWGGLTGGGLGALIGEAAADEPLAGAVIGSAVGAMTGAAVGSELDALEARHDARLQQAAYAQQAEGISLQEIVSMANAGLGDTIISRHIRANGFSGDLDAADLIALRQQGVSDAVIGELQHISSGASSFSAAPLEVVVPTRPVVVEERFHAIPVPVLGYPRRHRHVHPRQIHRRHPDFHWGISLGH